METNILEKETSVGKKLVQEAIFEVLKREKEENSIHLSCIEPRKDGTFAPLLGINEHLLIVTIRHEGRNIKVEMRDDLFVGVREIKALREKIKRVNRNPAMKDQGKRWMYFCSTERSSRLLISALIPIDAENGKEEIVGAFQIKFSFFIVAMKMFYSFGIYDEPEDLNFKPPLPPLPASLNK